MGTSRDEDRQREALGGVKSCCWHFELIPEWSTESSRWLR